MGLASTEGLGVMRAPSGSCSLSKLVPMATVHLTRTASQEHPDFESPSLRTSCLEVGVPKRNQSSLSRDRRIRFEDQSGKSYRHLVSQGTGVARLLPAPKRQPPTPGVLASRRTLLRSLRRKTSDRRRGQYERYAALPGKRSPEHRYQRVSWESGGEPAWMTPNVRAEAGPTAGRQARAGENVPRTARPGLVACRWASPRARG